MFLMSILAKILASEKKLLDRKAGLQTLNEKIPIIIYHCQKQRPLLFHRVILQSGERYS